jgi:hypothetical protein
VNWENEAKTLLAQIQGLKKSIEPMAKAELKLIWTDLKNLPKDASKEEIKSRLVASSNKLKVLLKDIEGEIKAAFNVKKSNTIKKARVTSKVKRKKVKAKKVKKSSSQKI